MPRHITLAEIGHGVGRRRQRRSPVPLLIVAVVLAFVGGLAVPLSGRASGNDRSDAAPACAGPATPLVLASSADKAGMLTRFAERFSAGGRDAQGRCVAVTVLQKSSGAAESALAKGWQDSDGPRPDVWSPSGSVWLPLLEGHLAQAQRSSLIPAPSAVPGIAASPMVVAMPRPMAEALGWPRRPIGWSDLLALASARRGWGAYGHPEWGRFSLGKTNPNFSHAGLEGTIATYYAAAHKTSGLTAADISSATTRRFVAGVEQSIVRYGDNTASFFADWQRADDGGQAMSYISALVTEENLVPAYNEGNPTADPALAGKHPEPKVPLVAIYPKEGTFVADHPYAVLSAPWVTAAKRDAAAAFLAYLRSPVTQKVWQDNHFRDYDNRPGQQASLAQGMIRTEPGKRLKPPPVEITGQILDSWSQLRKTANVISIVDVSGSMAEHVPGSGETRLDAAKAAAVSSLKLFTDRDEVGLWSFSGGKRGRRDYTPLVGVGPMDGAVGGRVRRDVIAAKLKGLQPGGDTGLYNTIAAAYTSVLDRYRPDRINAAVILTDGKNDAEGGLNLDGVLALIKRTSGGRPVRIFTIAYGPQADQESLARIARATKGAAYVAPSAKEIPKIYSAALSNV